MDLNSYLLVSCLPLLPFILVARRLRWAHLKAFLILWVLAIPLDWAQINLLGLYTPAPALAASSFLDIPLAEWVFIWTIPIRVWTYLVIGGLVYGSGKWGAK